ncbi:hypothetical protein Tco_1187428, partial [Tanacetum coccineum]
VQRIKNKAKAVWTGGRYGSEVLGTGASGTSWQCGSGGYEIAAEANLGYYFKLRSSMPRRRSDIQEELYEESSDQEEFYDEDSSDLEEYLGMFDETDQELVKMILTKMTVMMGGFSFLIAS